jgi:DNA repair photolyase
MRIVEAKETLRFKPVALPCVQEGATRLYTTNLFSGRCPHACVYCYASGFRDFASGAPNPVSQEAIRRVEKWPPRIFLSSASDPFHPVVVKRAEELLRAALGAGSFVVISTKALATDEIVRILSQYRSQVSYTIYLSSLSEERNRVLEPNAPSARERLHGTWEHGALVLCGAEELAASGVHITLKADSLFPGMDDTEDGISRLLGEAAGCGVQGVNFSYAFYRNRFKHRLAAIPLLKNSIAAMSERQPIASGTGFSLPLSEKRNRLGRMAEMAKGIGYKVISTCGCKNQVGPIPVEIPLGVACHFHGTWF